MKQAKESNLILKLPKDLLAALKAIAKERELSTDDLIRNVVNDYFEDENLEPPTVDYIVEQLGDVKTQFEEVHVLHISLYGAIVQGTATRSSKINLIFEMDCECSLEEEEYLRLMEIAEKQLGTKFKIMPEFNSLLSPEKLDLKLKDSVKIF